MVDSNNATAASLSWIKPLASTIHQYYILYKQDELKENWKVVKTTAQAISIGGLLPSVKYIVKVIGNSSKTAYWSDSAHFITSHCKFSISHLSSIIHRDDLYCRVRLCRK